MSLARWTNERRCRQKPTGCNRRARTILEGVPHRPNQKGGPHGGHYQKHILQARAGAPKQYPLLDGPMNGGAAKNQRAAIGVHAPFRGGCPTDPTRRVGHTGATTSGIFPWPGLGTRFILSRFMDQSGRAPPGVDGRRSACTHPPGGGRPEAPLGGWATRGLLSRHCFCGSSPRYWRPGDLDWAGLFLPSISLSQWHAQSPGRQWTDIHLLL